MDKKTILTGIKPTGEPHLGNYIGAIQPSLELVKQSKASYLFIADYHSLTLISDSKKMKTLVQSVAATWLACGLDSKKTVFYRQSHVPELFELYWILSCLTPKGLMNRAHSYKAQVDKNKFSGSKDLDDGVNMGLYSYPVLMAADILLFSAEQIPVGEDQIQHLEMTRDIAQKFNHSYKTDLFNIPQALFQKEKMLLGIDGQKMSKSYNNYIPLFCESKKLRKLIMKIKTDTSLPTEPKDTTNCLVFGMYKHFASNDEIKDLEKKYKSGIAWGEAKEILFEKLDHYFKEKKQAYEHYLNDFTQVEKILTKGEEQARAIAIPYLKKIKTTIGLI